MKTKRMDYGYEINFEGKFFHVSRSGNYWDIIYGDKIISTVKQVKEAKEYIRNYGEMGEVVDIDDFPSPWACLHPAAIVCLMLKEIKRGPTDVEKETLHCCGFLDESGQPDIDRAKRLLRKI